MGYQRKYSFSGFQANNPARPLPATKLDAELDAIGVAFDQTLDAFGVAKANGFEWNVVQWLASLKGDKGDRGEQGDRGLAGTPGAAGEKGAPGVQGIQGPRGDQGLQGDRGLKGDAGAEGHQGPQGDRGPQGLPGTAGVDGAAGAKGDKGDQGAQGLQGPKGDTGDTGDQGPKGDQGAGVTIKGSVASPSQLPDGAAQGDTYIVTGSGTGYTAGDGYAYTGTGTGTGYTNVGQIRGPQGPQGQQGVAGAKGDQGTQGPKGDQGLQGLKGDTGAVGAKGDPGAAGAKGDQGVQGVQGVKGDKGDAGTQGLQGLKGEKGDQGLQGPAGSLGFTPVQQGTGPGQGTNSLSLGWGTDKNAKGLDEAIMKGSVDGTDLGAILTDYSLAGGNRAAGRLNRIKLVRFFGAGLPGDHFVDINGKGAGFLQGVNGGFFRLGLGTKVTDTENLWDSNNFWYTCPEAGLYYTECMIRPPDSSGGYEFGFGLDVTEQDSAYFKWDYRPGITRWVAQSIVVRHLNAGDKIRFVTYAYSTPVTDAAVRIYLLKPDNP